VLFIKGKGKGGSRGFILVASEFNMNTGKRDPAPPHWLGRGNVFALIHLYRRDNINFFLVCAYWEGIRGERSIARRKKMSPESGLLLWADFISKLMMKKT